MKVEAYRVSKKTDGGSFCLPSDGYEPTISVDISLYKLIQKGTGMPAQSDQQFPLGAPIDNYVGYEGSLYKLK
jgi:hypothetical protein